MVDDKTKHSTMRHEELRDSAKEKLSEAHQLLLEALLDGGFDSGYKEEYVRGIIEVVKEIRAIRDRL